MRTKLFLAFLAIILTALASNVIFKRMVISDFEEYTGGVREDGLYRVLASVEGSYGEEGWDKALLRPYLHWAAMLGYEAEVVDEKGGLVMTTSLAAESLTPAMRRRMDAIVDMGAPQGEFEEYPLFAAGEEIGALRVRPIAKKGHLIEKEAMFKRRGAEFLAISFAIAGGGALVLTVFFTLFLTRPLRRLKLAAEAVAQGDLSVRVRGHGRGDEIGRLTETFNQMCEGLEREEALRRRLTQNIAHELRTPLTVMKAHLEAVADHVVEPTDEEVATLRAEVERLITLVEGIEDVTKAEASFFKRAELEEVDVRALLEAITRPMRALMAEKGLRLEFRGPGPLTVLADASKLETVLRNIISNAVRYTEQGEVTLDWGMEGRGRFFVEVRDTGRGIPEADLARVFERFYKGEGSAGIGLGLAIAKELAEVMGGSITASSASGQGAAFKVTLPVGGK